MKIPDILATIAWRSMARFSARSLIVFGITLCLKAQIADRYFYDDLAQLFKVVDSTGIVIEYVYDPVGNMLQIKRSVLANPAGLQVFNIAPTRTGIGATITIQGQGFSTNAAQDVVMIHGIAATVLSATSTSLVVSIPPNAMSGAVSVTVGGITAQWDNNLAIVPVPTITALTPHSASVHSTMVLAAKGSNLIGASFSFLSPLLPITATLVSADGTSATFSVTTGAPGYYGLVATTAAGSSTAAISPANSFCVLAGSATVDTDGDGLSDAQEILLGTNACSADTDGDGFSDGVEVASGSDPLDSNSTPFTGRIPGSTWNIAPSVLNQSGTVTGGPSEVDGIFSVLNSGGSQGHPVEIDNLFSVLNTAPSGNITTASKKAALTGANHANSIESGTLTNNRNVLITSLATETDTDGDGLADSDEKRLRTDPSNPDTDGDGYPDGLEVSLGSDPLDPQSVPDVRPPGVVSGIVLDIENSTKSIPQAGTKKQPSKGDKNVVQVQWPKRHSTVLGLQ